MINHRRDVLRLLGIAGLSGISGGILSGCSTFASKFESGSFESDSVNGLARLQIASSAPVGFSSHSLLFEHTQKGHPESRVRLDEIFRQLNDDQRAGHLGLLCAISSRVAIAEELCYVHTPEYLEWVRSCVDIQQYLATSKWSPYGGPLAYQAAAAAAAATIDLVAAVDSGVIRAGFALVRPPGHHAGPSQAMGYCILNNIALAVRSLQKKRPKHRIAVFDFDVHHGNGLQDIFYLDPNVLYISTHQDGWPWTGGLNKLGDGPGRGFNINVPLPMGTGDRGFPLVFQSIVEPALRRFKPDIIIGAAGFDTHWLDYQGGLSLSSTGQAHLMENLKRVADDICGGRLALVLEGGYHLGALAAGVSNAFQVLTAVRGAQPRIRDVYGNSPDKEPSVQDVISKVIALHNLQ